MTPESVRLFLITYLEGKTRGQGSHIEHLHEDCDLLLDGWIDSFGLLQLMAAFRERYGREIDFDGLPPEEMTVVGPLCRYVSTQLQQPQF
jgi:acyl carrier protein